jgi:O-antigen ligase
VNVYVGSFGGYIFRDGMLRATATAGQPIALGYLVAVGLGLYLFLQQSIKPRPIRWLGMALLTAGLIASLSRGPWVGAVALLVVFLTTGRNAAPRLIGFVLVVIFAFFVIAILPGGEKAINLLPFIGTTEAGTIEGRKELLEVSIRVFERHPWLGSADFLEAPELQALRTGLGIIDIVNSYIGIALETGAVGLSLFVGFFALILFKIFLAMRSIRERNSEERLLGRVLLTTLLAILLIIFTVSSITIVPVVYWSVAGMGVAYVQMVRNRKRTAIKTILPEEKKSLIHPLRSRRAH